MPSGRSPHTIEQLVSDPHEPVSGGHAIGPPRACLVGEPDASYPALTAPQTPASVPPVDTPSDPHELVSWVNQIVSYPALTTPQTPASVPPVDTPSDPHELVSWVNQIVSYPALTTPQTPASVPPVARLRTPTSLSRG